jgi:hypothetical protein
MNGRNSTIPDIDRAIEPLIGGIRLGTPGCLVYLEGEVEDRYSGYDEREYSLEIAIGSQY